VVRREGELTLHELCAYILSGNKGEDSLRGIRGLSFRDGNGTVVANPDRELIENLDTLPEIDYSLVELKKYAEPVYKNPYVMRYPCVGIITSRGCPGRCIFCTVKAVWGKTWRAKSIKKAVDEIELLNTKYGIRELSFLDDTVSLDKTRWGGICDEIIKRGLDIKWTTPNGIAYWTLDKFLLKKMKAAGCCRLTFGIESANEEIREFIGKPYSLSQVKELINFANKIGMWTICTNIIGFPYETKKQIMDTINFAKYSGTDFATFFFLSPHLTSDVYSYFRKENLLNFDYVFTNQNSEEQDYDAVYAALIEGGFPTKYFSADELKKMQINAYRSFIIYRAITYLVFLPLIRKMHSAEDVAYTAKLLFHGLKILSRNFCNKTTKSLLYKQ